MVRISSLDEQQLSELSLKFHRQGFVQIFGVFPDHAQVKRKLLASCELEPFFAPEPKIHEPGSKGNLKYRIMDRRATDRAAPEIGEFYSSFADVLRIVVSPDILFSSDDKSAYSTKVYDREQDEQGWHWDSNGITVVLYLSTVEGSGTTDIYPLDSDRLISVKPVAGSALVLQGRECYHRAAPVADGAKKLICPLNYFVGREETRDPRLNSAVYGGHQEAMKKETILVKSGQANVDKWVANLSELLPEYDVRRWDITVEPELVRHVVGWMPDALWVNQFPNIKSLVSIGSGVDHIKHLRDLRKDIPVIRTVSDDLVQRMREFVALSVLMWHRRLPEMIENQSQKIWERYTAKTSNEVRVGVMGYGAMGQAACKSLADLGFEVSAWANSRRDNVPYRYFSGNESLNEFASGLDALVCLLPATDSTKGILSSSLFGQMNPGGCVVNVGRGSHVVEQELLEAISAGQLKNAVLDVFDEEPLPKDSPLWDAPGVLISSHSAAFISPVIGPKLIANNIKRFDAGDEVAPMYDAEKGY